LLPLLLLLLSEACPDHNFLVFIDLEVKGQGATKVIAVRDTTPYHAPKYQISLTYLERQKCYGPDKKILFKKQLFDLEVKGQGPNIFVFRDRLLYKWPHLGET
jgi:hypothetical protein